MRKFYPKEAIYGLFVLSLANKSDFSMLNYYKSKINQLSVDSKTLLACSYKLLGDNTNFRNIMDKINMKFDERDETPYSNFSTPLRDMAITLYSLANADKNDVRIPSLTKIVSQKLKDNKNLTTQEAAFGFMAIGKILNNSQAPSNIKAKADSEGKNIVELNETTPNSSGKSYSSKVNISNIGDSKMYYFVNSVGKLKNGKIENFDNYIQIRREFFSSDGRKLNNKKDFKIGELVVVKLSVRGVESNFSTANLVISDLLPAGLEIENPRLSEQSSYKWLRDLVNPNHYDYRDDRVNIYFDLDKKADFYYTIRAITPGIYNWGAVTCEAMYESDVFSIYGGNEQIKVNK
jgi:uncharacterized protein YfaS (alpha-2-macroglobulin family)